jgi:hypothetical protein
MFNLLPQILGFCPPQGGEISLWLTFAGEPPLDALNLRDFG